MFFRKIFYFLLILIIPVTVFACARLVGYEIEASQEKGAFEYNKTHAYVWWPRLSIDIKKYPDLEVYINGEEITRNIESYGDTTYYVYSLEKFSPDFFNLFQKSFDIRIKQSDKEIYSAKWKVTNTTYSLPEKLSIYLLPISLFITFISFIFVLIGTFIKKFNFAKKLLLFSVIGDIIFLYIYFSAHC